MTKPRRLTTEDVHGVLIETLLSFDPHMVSRVLFSEPLTEYPIPMKKIKIKIKEQAASANTTTFAHLRIGESFRFATTDDVADSSVEKYHVRFKTGPKTWIQMTSPHTDVTLGHRLFFTRESLVQRLDVNLLVKGVCK